MAKSGASPTVRGMVVCGMVACGMVAVALPAGAQTPPTAPTRSVERQTPAPAACVAGNPIGGVIVKGARPPTGATTCEPSVEKSISEQGVAAPKGPAKKRPR